MIDIVGATTGRLFWWTVIQKNIIRRGDHWSPFLYGHQKIKKPPLRHCVTHLLKERLIGSHRGELVGAVD